MTFVRSGKLLDQLNLLSFRHCSAAYAESAHKLTVTGGLFDLNLIGQSKVTDLFFEMVQEIVQAKAGQYSSGVQPCISQTCYRYARKLSADSTESAISLGRI
jgi:hypothetical protein